MSRRILQSLLLRAAVLLQDRVVGSGALFVQILGSTCCLCTRWSPTAHFLPSLHQRDQEMLWGCGLLSPAVKGGEDGFQKDKRAKTPDSSGPPQHLVRTDP